MVETPVSDSLVVIWSSGDREVAKKNGFYVDQKLQDQGLVG